MSTKLIFRCVDDLIDPSLIEMDEHLLLYVDKLKEIVATAAQPCNVFQIPDYQTRDVKLMIEYLTIFHETPKEDEFSYQLQDWEREFENSHDISNELLFSGTVMANKLKCKAWLNFCCKVIANKIKGKSPDEIRATFGLLDDLTEKEKADIKRENQWIYN